MASAKICRSTLHASLNAARNRALVWTNDGAAMLYDARAGTQLVSLRAVLNSSTLSPDGHQAYKWWYDDVAHTNSLRVWNLP